MGGRRHWKALEIALEDLNTIVQENKISEEREIAIKALKLLAVKKGNETAKEILRGIGHEVKEYNPQTYRNVDSAVEHIVKQYQGLSEEKGLLITVGSSGWGGGARSGENESGS